MAESYQGKTALITGGSSGIGLDLARLFLKEGSNVILTASRVDKLREAAETLEKELKTKPRVLCHDLADPASPKAIFNALASQKIAVDILVNNAGFGIYGEFHKLDLTKTLQMIEVNVTSLVALTHLFAGPMVERKYGRILNVASTAAFQGIPQEQIYASSKAFVLTFSEGLTEELKDKGVAVTCLCPGATRTPLRAANIFPSKMMERNMMQSMDVAKIGMDALKKHKSLVISGFSNNAMIFAERFGPRTFVTKLAGRMVK